jgi:hypothetical protein
VHNDSIQRRIDEALLKSREAAATAKRQRDSQQSTSLGSLTAGQASYLEQKNALEEHSGRSSEEAGKWLVR